MTEKTGYPAGAPLWVDVASADVDASRAFYGSLFGWESDPGDPEFGGYSTFTLRGQLVAGIGPLMNEHQPPLWSVYLCTDDADKTTELVTAAGGQVVVPPMTVGDLGRMAVYTDPTGAGIGVWQPMAHTGAQLVDEPGTVCWTELVTRDVEAAKSFYSTTFPMTAEAAGPDPAYTMLHVDGQPVAGLMAMPAAYPDRVPAHWSVYFAVDDADAAVAKAEELGAKVRRPAEDAPWGRFAVLADPQGAVFAVIKVNPDMSG